MIVAGVMLLPTIFMGCSEAERAIGENSVSESASSAVGAESRIREVLLTVQLPTCKVDILSHEIDSTSKTVILRFDAWFDEDSPTRRVMRVSVADDANGRPGYRATLTDERQRLLWEFDGRIDPDNEDHSWLTERSSEDGLTIEQMKGDESFVETYTLNGRQEEFHFPTGDMERIERLRDASFSDGYRFPDDYSTLPQADKEIIETFVEFESFYDWDNSLHQNSEGFLVAELLTSEAVAEWAADKLGEGLIPITIPWELLCAIAVQCAAIKCPIPGNPACVGCGFVVLFCVVKTIFDALS